MKRDRSKIEVPYVDWLTSKYDIIVPYIHRDVYKFVSELYKDDLDMLYYGDLYVIPITLEGEEYRIHLYEECCIGSYGAYEHNFIYNGEIYLVILVNND